MSIDAMATTGMAEMSPSPSDTTRRGMATGEHPGPVALIMTVAWFGLASGLAQLVRVLAKGLYDPSAWLGPRLLNRHYLWMTPVSDLVIFGLGGLALGLVARRWPRTALRLSIYLVCVLAALAWLPARFRLHSAVRILLGCGFASLTMPLIERWALHITGFARRTFPILVGALVALVGFSYGREMLGEYRALARLPAAAPDAPNVLLIVLDTLRADALNCYGYRRDTSPNLSRLASKGVRFERAISTAPWTLPSHASMFTGMLPRRLGVHKWSSLDAKYPTLAEALSRAGM